VNASHAPVLGKPSCPQNLYVTREARNFGKLSSSSCFSAVLAGVQAPSPIDAVRYYKPVRPDTPQPIVAEKFFHHGFLKSVARNTSSELHGAFSVKRAVVTSAANEKS